MKILDDKKKFKQKMKNYKKKIRISDDDITPGRWLRGIYTNAAGYVIFASRNFCFKGDRFTYAMVNEKKLFVVKAKSGNMSEQYRNDFTRFCKIYDIDFEQMACGDILIWDEETETISPGVKLG